MTRETHSGKAELREAASGSLGLLGSAFVFSAFVNLLMMTGPLFMLQVYDRVLQARSEETLLALFILVALLYLTLAVLDYVRSRLFARFGNRFRNKLDKRVFEAQMNTNAQALELSETGLRDLNVLQSFFNSPIMSALFDIPWIPLFIAAIFVFHPVLGWAALSGGVGLVVLAALNNALSKRPVQRAHGFLNRANALSVTMRRESEFIRSQGMLENLSSKWISLQDQYVEGITRVGDASGGFVSATKATKLFLQSLMLALGAWLTLQGELGAGAMIASSIILGRALGPIEQIVGQWSLIQSAIQAWRGLSHYLSIVPETRSRVKLPIPKVKIIANSITVLDEKSRKSLLANVSFTLLPGQVVGVIGNSGAGKSTLAKALLNILPINVGEIRLGGALLNQYDPIQLGNLVGYLPQNLSFFEGTISENIARMAQGFDQQQVFDAAQLANVHDLILSMVDGYETQLDSFRSQLSGGELQRIALARALFGNPKVLVLDEPSSALDSAGTHALNRAISGFRKSERLVIIMTHRPQAIAECDQLLVLENGKLRAAGPREDVLNAMVRNGEQVKASLVEPGADQKRATYS